MFWKNQSFKDLQSEWYQRIADFGFKDIEETEGDLCRPAQRASYAYDNVSDLERIQRLDYHLLLAFHINDKAHEFEDGIEYFIMTKFSNGWTNAEIGRTLRVLGKPRHRKTIMFIRRKYENKWGIKEWKPEQLRSKKFPKKSLG